VPNGCGEPGAVVFFVTYMLVVAFIFINLFVAVILEGFAESEAIENGSLNSVHLLDFKLAWVEFDPDGTGFIKTTELRPLLATMRPPLGFKDASKDYKTNFMHKIENSNMPVYHDDKYHFYEVASELARMQYTEEENLEESNNAFKRLEKRRDKRWPTLKFSRSRMTMGGVFAVMRVRNRMLAWAKRARDRLILKNPSEKHRIRRQNRRATDHRTSAIGSLLALKNMPTYKSDLS
jgi:Ca2+-binding EF-hand superfamily protein